MDENFREFKKEVWIEILIKCLACAIAAAFLAVDAVFVPCRLYGVDLFGVYYILIALGGFALGGGIAFLVFRTDDRKIAIRLDKEFRLAQRVQTAYTFSGQQSDILELQREDTKRVLGGISLTSLKFANLVALILSAVIAVGAIVALPVTIGTVPFGLYASKTQAPVDEPKHEVTDWEWAALDELIYYVQTTQKADATLKAGMYSELNDLRNVLLDGVSQSSLSSFVQYTASSINNHLKDANANYEEEDEQYILNAEDASYVVSRLYAIFKIRAPGEENEDKKGENKDPEDGDDKGDEGPGYEIGGNDVPFFDAENGYTTAGQARDKYYEIVQKAFEEGTISREEWEYIMATYFADLSKDE